MIDEERIANLTKFGYDRAEASFLCCIALHGGYFVRRQFDTYLNVQRGRRTSTFVDKLLTRCHARRHLYEHSPHVFHLHFRPFYAAAGDPNSRNRREHQPQVVKTRLMEVDFVLAHVDFRYFRTESERISLFTEDLKIPKEVLPAKLYGDTERSPARRCYFVDRFPIFLRPGTAEMSFCYIDAGFETNSPFATFLRSYSALFDALPSFELVYASTDDARSDEAERVFERVLSRGRPWLSQASDIERLASYFRDRALFERRETADFDRERLDRLRDGFDSFAGDYFDRLFETWNQFGEARVRQQLAAVKRPSGCFSRYRLLHAYDITGRVGVAS